MKFLFDDIYEKKKIHKTSSTFNISCRFGFYATQGQK